MNIAILDVTQDFSALLAQNLRDYCLDHGHAALIYTYADSKMLQRERSLFDLIFIDVDHFDMETCKLLHESYLRAKLILMSEHDTHLDDAFALGAFWYLPKPMDMQRLYIAMDAASRDAPDTVSFYDPSRECTVNVRLQDIMFIEIENRHTRLVTDGDAYNAREKMEFWKLNLPDATFLCPHKSFVVNRDYCQLHKRDEFTLVGKRKKGSAQVDKIPVDSKKQPEVKKLFKK